MRNDIQLVKNVGRIKDSNIKPKYKFGWIVTDNDAILNLGAMKKAVVIRRSIQGNIFISEASFFWFPNKFYQRSFNNMDIAIEVANKHIREWLESCNDALGI